MDINAKLKQLRKQKGINQDEAAELLGVSLSSYQKYEREKNSVTPSIEVLIKIADYYNVSLDYLLGRSENQTDPLAAYDLDEEERRFFIGFLNKEHIIRKLVIQTFKPLFEQFKFTVKDEEGNEKEIQFKNLFEL